MQTVLDDVVDKESGAEPKLVGPAGGVGSVVRHISQDELDAYVEGRLAGARLDFVRSHLDACEACRAELEDLRTFKASAVGQSQASTLKRELERRKRQRQLKAAATAAAAAAVVATIGVVGWNKYGKAWVHTHAQGGAIVAQPHTDANAHIGLAQAQSAAGARAGVSAQTRVASAAPAATASQVAMQSRGAASNGATAPQSAQVRGAKAAAGGQPSATAQVRGVNAAGGQVSAAAQTRVASAAPGANQGAAVQQPAQMRGANAAQGQQGLAPSAEAPAGSTSFALLGPFGDEVTDDRPEFAWQPLAGATKYSIIIVDEGLRPIAHTRLKTTTWRPHKPLRRGRSYLWQVTAILKNGTKVMATGPTSQEARIHIGAPPK